MFIIFLLFIFLLNMRLQIKRLENFKQIKKIYETRINLYTKCPTNN